MLLTCESKISSFYFKLKIARKNCDFIAKFTLRNENRNCRKRNFAPKFKLKKIVGKPDDCKRPGKTGKSRLRTSNLKNRNI